MPPSKHIFEAPSSLEMSFLLCWQSNHSDQIAHISYVRVWKHSHCCNSIVIATNFLSSSDGCIVTNWTLRMSPPVTSVSDLCLHFLKWHLHKLVAYWLCITSYVSVMTACRGRRKGLPCATGHHTFCALHSISMIRRTDLRWLVW